METFAFYSGFYLQPMRRLDEALKWMRKTIELDPLSPSWQMALGAIYSLMRQDDRAIEQFRKALELDPYSPMALMGLGSCYVQTGKPDEGIRACEMAAQLGGRHPMNLALLGAAYASAGRVGEAQKLIEELQGLAVKAYVPSLAFAIINSGLGEIDKALDWFEKTIEEHDATIGGYFVSPLFDPLRSHPRFHALLRKMNLEP